MTGGQGARETSIHQPIYRVRDKRSPPKPSVGKPLASAAPKCAFENLTSRRRGESKNLNISAAMKKCRDTAAGEPNTRRPLDSWYYSTIRAGFNPLGENCSFHDPAVPGRHSTLLLQPQAESLTVVVQPLPLPEVGAIRQATAVDIQGQIRCMAGGQSPGAIPKSIDPPLGA